MARRYGVLKHEYKGRAKYRDGVLTVKVSFARSGSLHQSVRYQANACVAGASPLRLDKAYAKSEKHVRRAQSRCSGAVTDKTPTAAVKHALAQLSKNLK